MRKTALFLGDIRFQFKYGFYNIYVIFSLLYIGLLFAFPPSWRQTAGILMIFSDPAAMGLYFMGAIVLFEKCERVLNSIAVSPVKPLEYVISKLLSLAVISTVVAAVIGLSCGIIQDAVGFLIAVFFCSCLFSAVGLIVAAKISTLNGFILVTLLPEILINFPAFAYLFGFKATWLLFHPGVCMIEICLNGQYKLVSILVLILWTVFFIAIAGRTVQKMLQSVGGMKL